jgi:hypothetical protein
MNGKSIVAKYGILKIDEVVQVWWVMIFCRAVPGL